MFRKLLFFFDQLSILSTIQLHIAPHSIQVILLMFVFIAFVVRSFFCLKNACLAYAILHLISVALFPSLVTTSEVCITIYIFQVDAIHDYVGVNLLSATN